MKNNKKKNKKPLKKAPEKKNLSIVNQGDVVTIRNRSTTAASVLGGIILTLAIIGCLVMKEAWQLPMFWGAFSLLIFGTVWSFLNMIFGKIVLDSPSMTMNVYNPIKKQYKFEEINYIDQKTVNGKDGVVIYKVIVYIGDGKRSVEIASLSSSQADELTALLRGMLDNGAMVYPEGDEEPFNFDEEKEEKRGLFSFGKSKNKIKPDSDPDTPKVGSGKENTESADSTEDDASDTTEAEDEKETESPENEDSEASSED